ncbi:MAG: sulfite exporter TauE/SafE family protein [Candidatus Woesearchaeota archaeon]
MFDHALLILIGALFSIISMTFGIGISPMFLPFFVLVMGFPFSAAIASALIIELVTFSSALFSFIRQRIIAYHLATQILINVIPAAIVGVVLSTMLSQSVLIIIFSSGLLLLATLVFHPDHEIMYRFDEPSSGYIHSEFGIARSISLFASTTSGVLQGITGMGAGEINNYVFLKKYRMSADMATATSVFIIAVAALVVSSGQLIQTWLVTPHVLSEIVVVSALGCAGSLMGVFISSRYRVSLSGRVRERYVASLLFALGIVGFLTLII